MKYLGTCHCKSVKFSVETNLDKVENLLNKNSIFYEIIGNTQKENLEVENEFKIKSLQTIN